MPSHCQKCGAANPGAARFCPTCGTRFAPASQPPSIPTRSGAARSAPPALPAKRNSGRSLLALRGWDAAAVFGGGAGGALWYWYSSLDQFAPKDTVTPFLILGIPVFIVFFRSLIDRLLMPFQKIRRKIPRLILIGAGLVAPYLISQQLYGYKGLSEYPYVRACIVVGTLVSYIIIRNPQSPRRLPTPPPIAST